MARWRFPTLSIHKVDVSGPASNTVIPRNATATVSMRIVPDQDLDSVCTAFEQYVSDLFLALESSNRLKVVYPCV